MSKFYQISNEKGRFVFSGYTGFILESNDELEAFIGNKCSCPDDLDEETAAIVYGEESEFDNKELDLRIGALTVFVTNSCNLGCSYCYHSQNDLKLGKPMDIDSLLESIAYIEKQIGFKSEVGIAFFGGEPLLDFDFIDTACEKLREIGKKMDCTFKFALTTNGTILSEEVKKILIKNDINVTVSIDGFQDLHDTYRVFKSNGGGSYNLAIDNAASIAKIVPTTIRVTLPLQKKYMDLIELHDNMAKIGAKGFQITVVNSDDIACDVDEAFIRESVTRFAEYALDKFKNEEIISLYNLLNPLKEIHRGIKSREFPCQAGGNYLALSTQGELFLCHRFVGVDKFKIADTKSTEFKDSRAQFLKRHHVDKRADNKCKECLVSRFCGGDCYHHGYLSCDDTNQISDMQCAWRKEFMIAALNIYTSLSEDERYFLNNI